MVGGFEVVVDILEIDVDTATPLGCRLRFEDFKTLQAEVSHPLRLVLHIGDLLDDFGVDSFPCLEDGFGIGPEIIFVNLTDIPRRF